MKKKNKAESTHESAYRRQLDALMQVMHEINSSRGLKETLVKVLDLEIELTNAERGFIFLLEEDGTCMVEAARNRAQRNLDENDFSISQTIVRSVTETGKAVLTSDAQEDPRFEGEKSVIMHNLRSIMCAPLKLKEKIIGVVLVDSRVHSNLFRPSDLEMLSAFANQATVAIDNARLLDGLERAHEELIIAYDETLEGWASFIELKDKATEGHTRRVTYLTEKLAKKMGMSGEELVHIKRGALLHDIGKMGVPDHILKKPGPLSSDERLVMEVHPDLAKDVLEKISFLHPAIDIPYCHHEKWDGTGYPKNLKGKEIPIAARIFAVVDVWDALTSKRVYRERSSPEEVRAFIRAQSGKHFDPELVSIFLDIYDVITAIRTKFPDKE